MSITSADIQKILVQCQFPYRRWLVVPNVSWGMMPWECDLLAMSKSGYLHEIEIKVSVADLRADAKKHKHALGWKHMNILREFWYAAPREVWRKAGHDCIPPDVGIIEIDTVANRDYMRAIRARECKPNTDAIKATEKQRFQLARLGTMRYWSRVA